MSEELKCPICGEPTYLVMGKNPRKDRLCGKHATMLYKKEIYFDEGKQAYFDSKTKKRLIIQHTTQDETVSGTDKSSDELTCLFCKAPSNGKHFCKDCYYKYKEREIDVHITHLTEWKITDEYGNQKVQCKNGMKVRSRAEKIIADFFFDHNIRIIYETDIPYMHRGEMKVLNPDFFLPDYGEIAENGKRKGIIIEYNELETLAYRRQKNFTQKGYEELGFEVIVLSTEDINNDLLKLKIRFNLV